MGKNHSKFVMSLVFYLVSLHPFIDVIEPDINDIYYSSSLILLFNAVNENSTLLPMLPKYVINHYFFLKLQLPDLIPNIKLIENSSNSIHSLLTIENKENLSKNRNAIYQNAIESFFERTKSNLKLIHSLQQNNSINHAKNDCNTLKIYQAIKQDIVYLSELDSNLSIACDIMKQFLDSYLKVKKLDSKTSLSEKSDLMNLIQIEEVRIV